MSSDEFCFALNWRNLLSLIGGIYCPLCIQRIGAETHLDTPRVKHGENVQGKREYFGVSQTADQEDAAQTSFIAREKGVLSYDG